MRILAHGRAPSRHLWCLAAAFLAATPTVTWLPASAQAITDISPENAAVNAAIAKAKDTLPTFFERLAAPQPGDSQFLVKLRYPKSKTTGHEHIWAKDVVRNGDAVTATIDNEPRDIASLAKGQRVTVPVSEITDWLYVRDGKYQGAYTVRALLSFMPADRAAEMKERLAPE
jgi:uncharacterized protein YegJ (DUF2314 family)